MSSIRDQLAAFIEVADAAFNKLALPQRSQIYVQVGFCGGEAGADGRSVAVALSFPLQHSWVGVEARWPHRRSATAHTLERAMRPRAITCRPLCLFVLAGWQRNSKTHATSRRAPSHLCAQASLFRLYELAALATAAEGDEQPRLIELLAALAAEVAPGSEEAVYWARRYRWAVWKGCG